MRANLPMGYDDCLVDVMPVGEGVTAYKDRWSPAAIEKAQHLELEPGLWIRHVTAPFFVAIKLETFHDRGNGNYQDSNDIDDIIQLLDGRPELLAELRASSSELYTYVAEEFRALLKNSRFVEAISAHLLPDTASQARESLIMERMMQIASLGYEEFWQYRMIVFQRFTDGPHICMYLPEQQATLQYEMVAQISPAEYETRMDQGWRKFGGILFHPICADCRECRPIRIPIAEFAPDRSQKRCLKQNADLTIRYAQPTADAARLDLYRRYHDAQSIRKHWPGTDKSEDDYEMQFVANPVPGVEISVWEGDILRGMMLTDVTPNVVSAIYHFHDPEARERSLGTFLILQTLQMAQRLSKAYCYMGYYVADCASMNYKRRFQPSEVLNTRGEWVRI